MNKEKFIAYLENEIKEWEKGKKDSKDDYENGYADASITMLNNILADVNDNKF